MPDLYAIAYYNCNDVTPKCIYLTTLSDIPSWSEDISDYCFVNSDTAFTTFLDLKEAKKCYHSLLNALRKNVQRFSPNTPIESYASFYKIINLNTPKGLKISINSYGEFCQRAVYTHEDYFAYLNLNESSFKHSFSDIMWKLLHYKKEEFLDFKFQSFTQFKEIKEKGLPNEKKLPNDSIYYSFKQGNSLKSPYLIYVNENENKQYVTNIDFDMIQDKFRVLD